MTAHIGGRSKMRRNVTLRENSRWANGKEASERHSERERGLLTWTALAWLSESSKSDDESAGQSPACKAISASLTSAAGGGTMVLGDCCGTVKCVTMTRLTQIDSSELRRLSVA
jgi:hypothetical protein